MPRGDTQGYSNRICCVFQPVCFVQFASCTEPYMYVCSAFSPSLLDLVSTGLVSIFTDLVSVTVSSEWLLLTEFPWIPACPAQGLWLRLIACPGTSAHLIRRHYPQAHLLAMSLNVQ